MLFSGVPICPFVQGFGHSGGFFLYFFLEHLMLGLFDGFWKFKCVESLFTKKPSAKALILCPLLCFCEEVYFSSLGVELYFVQPVYCS